MIAGLGQNRPTLMQNRFQILNSYELHRVLALPRRRIDLQAAEQIADEYTRICSKNPLAHKLRPVQALALHELRTVGGLFLGMPVGGGKTLISWLAAYVTDARRPLLLIPANLRNKTYHEFGSLRLQWESTNGVGIEIRSYEELTQADNVNLLGGDPDTGLGGIKPDLIILDEADVLRNPKASHVRRLDRYITANPDVIVVVMSGSLGRKSVADIAHLLRWALKRGSPLPLNSEAAMWARALDLAGSGYREMTRPDPGALAQLPGFAELGGDIDALRAAWNLRLVETPGVIIVDGDSCDQPITIRQLTAPEDSILDQHFEPFRLAKETPDGWPLSDSLSVYRHAGELGTGMYLRWDPRPPQTWLGPRKAFCQFVRDVIEDDLGYDTELAVRRAFKNDAEAGPIIKAWEDVRESFTPNSVPVWLTDSVLGAAVEWLAAENEPSLVWVTNPAFGRALRALTRLPYYGENGQTEDGEEITHADPKRSAILSLGSNMRGRNLQAWARNLLINPPRSGRYLEQTFGRTHRSGQTRPVLIDILMTSGDTFDGFEAAIAESDFGRVTFGLTAKLLRAEIVRSDVPNAFGPGRFRWSCKRARHASDVL